MRRSLPATAEGASELYALIFFSVLIVTLVLIWGYLARHL